MKRLYTFIALVLAMLCTVSVDAQKYRLDEEAAVPETGVTYAIYNVEMTTFISCKYGPNGGLLSILEDEDVLWKLEATGEKTAAGYDLYYIYSVGQDAYVQEVDLEGNPGLDGYDVFSYNGFNFELGDKAGAAKVTIVKGTPGDDIEEGEKWRSNGPSTGFVIGRQNLPNWYDGDGNAVPKMMKFGVQGTNVAWEPYNERVAWQFWTVAKLGPQDELEAVVDEYSKTEFVAGTDPGYYRTAAVEAYNTSLESAMLLVLQTATDEQYQAALDDLRAKRAAVEAAMVPLAEGYYFIVSGFDDFLNNFGVEKAVFQNTDANLIAYKTFDATDVNFVWYIEPNTNGDAEADEFWVQHYVTGNYVAKGTQWYNSATPLTSGPEEPQNIRQYTSGKWYWGSRTYHNTSYTPYASSAPTASDSNGNLTSWGQWGDDSTVNTHFNLWYFRAVSDEQMKDFTDKKAQADRTQEISNLAGEAQNLYAKLFTYKTGTEGLITVAGGNGSVEAGTQETNVEGNQLVFYKVRTQGVTTADDYKFLIDGDDETYMQGAEYIEIDLSATPKKVITFEYYTRCASMEKGNANQHKWGVEERPNNITIYATNDTVDGGDWKKVASASMGTVTDAERTSPFPPVYYTIDLGDTYKFVRYEVNTSAVGGSFFTLSEFQVYEATVDETTSQYYTTEGLKEKADALMAAVIAKQATAAEATEADVAELRAALAAVQELYADTAALAELADECLVLANTTAFGTGIGHIAEGSKVGETLNSVATAAKAKISPAISVDEVKEQMAALRAAKEAYMTAITPFEPNVIYYLENAATDGESEPLYYTAPDKKNVLKAGTNGDELTENSAEAMWMFIPTEGGNYYIQNVATGFYVGAYTTSASVTLSYTPVELAVNYTGYGAYSFVPVTSMNNSGLALGLAAATTGDATGAYLENVPGTTTSWAIKTLSEDIDAISTTAFAPNTTGVMALPYNLSAEILDANDNFAIYGIKNITQTTNDEGELVTTIDFYAKNEAAADEPVVYVYGDGEGQITVPLPTALSSTKAAANGIVGMPYGQTATAGVAYGSGNEFKAVNTTAVIAAQTGVIDPSTFKGEVEDAETAFSITLTGLKALPSASSSDVNGDGEINSADVVAVYNWVIDGDASGVSKDAADVNGDGAVDAADVVAIYNAIIGEDAEAAAKSGAFAPEADGDTEMTAFVGSAASKSEIPVTITLTNPSVDITAVEANLEAPVSVKNFIYDDEEEDYKTGDTDRWLKKHTAKYAAGTALHGANGFFISITNPDSKPFKETEGAIVTVYFDGSELEAGDYVVKMYDALAVGCDAASYHVADVEAKFTVNEDGSVTAIKAVAAEEAVAAGKAVYTVDGKKVAAPQKGQIYVVDGKTVKF